MVAGAKTRYLQVGEEEENYEREKGGGFVYSKSSMT
jgi:hypothetical protein